MNIKKLAAFSLGTIGGNPAGVVVVEGKLPASEEMQDVAAKVGFSETVFALAHDDGWLVRYFSPEAEVPFCGHATIALAAAVAMQQGDGTFRIQTASGDLVEVEGRRVSAELGEAAFLSPPSSNTLLSPPDLNSALRLFALDHSQLSAQIPPAVIYAGANHLLLPLRERAALADMSYDFSAGQAMMREKGWVTIMLITAESDTLIHARNAFAYGGVVEDPATGAAAAALCGYLRTLGYRAGAPIEIHQGDDIGVPCRLYANIPADPSGRVRVRGTARFL